MIDTRPLFPILSDHLVYALRSLSADQWALPTRCRQWTVKDVAAHLLQTAVFRLSAHRDDYQEVAAGSEPAADFDRLVQMINESNAKWVRTWRAMSPRVLVDIIEVTEPQLNEWIKDQPLEGEGRFPVAWAGQSVSQNWFDIAREYTERWHHQQHIREAVGLPLMLQREMYHPVLETFVLALPHTLENVDVADGETVEVVIRGGAGGSWQLSKSKNGWGFRTGTELESRTRVEIAEDLAWKLFTKGVRKEELEGKVKVAGNAQLGEKVLGMVSVMA